MGPSRRKGARKAAMAGASRHNWKIGDLVLAKVKGFPAWPARVSEPKNWGFKEDLKKVFVYFFGTEQIAFCTSADVESFTEEKKVSLLGKRHAKGSDFVRAVNEIIDSYEEFKKKEKIDADCTNENAKANDTLPGSVSVNKMVESLHKFKLKEDTDSPVLGPELKIAESTGDDSDFTSLADAAVSLLEKDSLHGHEMLAEEPSFNVAVPYSSRRKVENLRIADCLTQRRSHPGRRSRSSRVDTSRLKNFMTPDVDNCSYRDMVTNISQDRTGRRSKRLRRSPDGSGKDFIDSPPLISNCSINENLADTVTISDFLGFNDEVDVDSACKSVLIESAEHCGEELEHNQNVDFQSNAIRFRKKRRPNRKGTGNETIEFTAGLDKVEKFDSELSKNGHALPSDHKKLSDHISKENGDEHLPLVKRARARMGASPHQMPSSGEQTAYQAADKMLDISKKVSVSLNCEVNDSANGNLLTDRENGSANGNSYTARESGNLSPLNISTSKKLQSREVKSQPFSSLLDEEAALPPSKRLHRALEAMSVNAAEDGQTSSDGPAFVNTSINGYSSSSSGVCHKVMVECVVGGEVGITDDDSPKSDPSIAMETEKASEEFSANGRTSDNDDNPINECCNDAIEAVESGEFKHLGPSLKKQSCDTKDRKQDLNLSPVSGASPESDRGSPGLVGQLSDECEAESSKSAKTSVETETQSVDKSLDPALGKGSSPDSLQQCTNSQLSSEVNICIGTVELPELPSNELELNHTMDDGFEKSVAIRSPKATTTSCQEEHVCHSDSISDDLLVEKAVSTTQSSSSLTDGLDSGRRTSPLVSSVRDVSFPNKTKTAVVNNAGCNPEGHMNVDRSNNEDGKAEHSDAVESFEAVLGTLKRSRESIARATNKAIDCARMGTASRVVDIITCNLENETSLHRKVDLFFLVDSITQCSRGMKGTLGGVYLQAIQTVLSRLVPAAAPPGSSARENRRQCLKVLRVWLEKRIFPESIIRHHIRELDALSCSSSAGISSRSLKTERPFDDPIRQMDGMMVDEYGSNSSIQLPGFFMPPMLTDGDCGSDSDDNFEAVTPEHNTEYLEGSRAPAIKMHSHILEDVDGELEMEDVSPSCEDDSSSMRLVDSVHSNFDHFEDVSLPIAPKTRQPSIHSMSLVLPPPPPPSHAPSTISDSHCNLLQPKLYSSSVNMKDDKQESFGHRSISSRGNSFRHHGPDRRDFPHPPMRMPDGHTHDPSYNSRPVLHPSTRPGSNIQANDASDKGFYLHPPHLAPPNQFSYVHPDQRMPSRKDVPPNPHRYHMAHCSDHDNFFRNRGRMKHAPRDVDDCWRPRDVDDCWRSPAPPFSGPCHPDFPRRPYGPVPYSGPPRGAAFPNRRWSNPRRGTNYKKYMPHRSPPGGPIPVSSKGSNYWRSR